MFAESAHLLLADSSNFAETAYFVNLTLTLGHVTANPNPKQWAWPEWGVA